MKNDENKIGSSSVTINFNDILDARGFNGNEITIATSEVENNSIIDITGFGDEVTFNTKASAVPYDPVCKTTTILGDLEAPEQDGGDQE